MRPTYRPAVMLLLLPGLLLAGAPAATATGPSNLRCGDVVTADARLTRTLRCTTSPGLTLAAGVSLDLAGHSLIGPGSGDGIVTDAAAPSTVRHGTVLGWGTGVARATDAGTGTSLTVEDVTFRGNDVALHSDFGGPLVVHRSRFVDNGAALGTFYASATVTDSTFVRNASAATAANGMLTVSRSRFTDNTRTFGSGGGLRLSHSVVTGSELVYYNYDAGGAEITDSTFAHNGVVLAPDWSDSADQVLRNRFLHNDVAVRAVTPKHLVGNVFVGNGVAVASDPEKLNSVDPFVAMEGNTFLRNGDAVHLTYPASLRDTVAIGNTGYGIYAPLATDLGGNVAYRNGVEPQCTGVVCAPRPHASVATGGG